MARKVKSLRAFFYQTLLSKAKLILILRGILSATIQYLIIYILKIAILVLGIVAIVYYKGESRVGSAPSVLLIVGGAVGLIPALGWVGGILAIIGGSLFLGSLKKFKVEG